MTVLSKEEMEDARKRISGEIKFQTKQGADRLLLIDIIDTIDDRDKQINDLRAKVLEGERDIVIDDLITRGVTSILTEYKDGKIIQKRVESFIKHLPNCDSFKVGEVQLRPGYPCTCGAVKEPEAVMPIQKHRLFPETKGEPR